MFDRYILKNKKLHLFMLIGLYFAIAYPVMNYFGIPCVFVSAFGIPCPGCGMTRALFSLLELDIVQAAKYNITIFFMPYVFLYIFLDFRHKIHNFIIAGIGLIFVINWIIKLVYLF